MPGIDADYLGGDPTVLEAYKNGELSAAAGSLTFLVQILTGALSSHRVEFTIAKDEIRAISVGDANHMKALTRTAIGAAIGGSAGALIGAATGRRNHVFLVAARREGFDFLASFAVRGDEGSSLLHAIQAGRRDRGEDPLPQVEQLAEIESLDVSGQQLRVLEDVRTLLIEQNRLLHLLTSGESQGAPASLEEPG